MSGQIDVWGGGFGRAGILDIIVGKAPRGAFWDNIYVVKFVFLTINML